MARVTVEDCLDNVDNRFQLVLIATKRARQLASGAEPFLEWENDKPTIVALREIADGLVGPAILDEPVRPEIDLAGEFADSEETTETPETPAEPAAAPDAGDSGPETPAG